MKKDNKKNDDKPSSYSMLYKWLYDGSKSTKIPEDVINDKNIGQNFLLYFFQYSPYIVVISKMFNNFDLYSLDRSEIFKFIKDCILVSGYKQQYIQRSFKTSEKFEKMLFKKFPYLKRYEIPLLVEFIDKSPQKDDIYHMFGLYEPKKKKATKADILKIEKNINKEKVTSKEVIELL